MILRLSVTTEMVTLGHCASILIKITEDAEVRSYVNLLLQDSEVEN